MKIILVLAWCGLVAMAAEQVHARGVEVENPTAEEVVPKPVVDVVPVEVENPMVLEVENPNVVSKQAVDAGLLELESFKLRPTNPPCCPHGEPYRCPYTTSPLEFFSFSKPNKYCKVIPCHNETIYTVSCTCSSCKYGTSRGLCQTGYCARWAMLSCFNFDLWQMERPQWQQIKVPCYCYCQSVFVFPLDPPADDDVVTKAAP